MGRPTPAFVTKLQEKYGVINIAVNTVTQEESDKFLSILDTLGITWMSGHKPSEKDYWPKQGLKMAYNLTSPSGLSYDRISFYNEKGYTILSLEQFMTTLGIEEKPTLTAREMEMLDTATKIATLAIIKAIQDWTPDGPKFENQDLQRISAAYYFIKHPDGQ